MSKAVPPGPRGWPLVGALPELAHDVLGFWQALASRYGPVAAYPSGRELHYLVSDPKLIGRLLRHDTALCRKGKMTKLLIPVFGRGLITADGDDWRTQRQWLAPGFAREREADWFGPVLTATDALLDQWAARLAPTDPLYLFPHMQRLTQAIIIRLLFGCDLDPAQDRALHEVASIVNAELLQQVLRASVLGGRLNQLPLPGVRRFRAAAAQLHAAIRRLAEAPAGGLAKWLPRTGEISTGDPHDTWITLFMAGHETTACALAWTFHHLTQHPDAMERVAAEAQAAFADAATGVAALDKLVYTQQVIDESLRLTPPAHGLERVLAQATELGGFHLDAGALMFLSPYVMHRHPNYWDDPNRFDPERFAPKRSRGRPRYAYFPFGGGPRICLGMHLARLELLVVVARVLARFRLSATGAPVAPCPLLTLRPYPGVPVRMVLR